MPSLSVSLIAATVVWVTVAGLLRLFSSLPSIFFTCAKITTSQLAAHRCFSRATQLLPQVQQSHDVDGIWRAVPSLPPPPASLLGGSRATPRLVACSFAYLPACLGSVRAPGTLFPSQPPLVTNSHCCPLPQASCLASELCCSALTVPVRCGAVSRNGKPLLAGPAPAEPGRLGLHQHSQSLLEQHRQRFTHLVEVGHPASRPADSFFSHCWVRRCWW